MKKIQLTRWEGNPLLVPIHTDQNEHWWEARSVYNPGAVVFKGKIYLLYRAIGTLHFSNLGLAILKDPFTIERRLPQAVFTPKEKGIYDRFGVEDPRIVFLEDKFWVVYTAASTYSAKEEIPDYFYGNMFVPWRLRCCLASTDDFVHFRRHGIILPRAETKDGTLFPEKVQGKYFFLHRIFPDIWISSSRKINRFSKGKILCSPREDNWDNAWLGAGTPPIKTPLGWLEFYHGVNQDAEGENRYMMGILLLDLQDPTKILYRSEEPVLKPEKEYERKGYVNRVVFPCGIIEWEENFYIYYGGADSCIGVASIDKKELLDALAERILKNGQKD